MKTGTKQKIIDFVTEQNQVTAKLIIEHVGLTPPAVFRHLAKLVSAGILMKRGTPPKVFYSSSQAGSVQSKVVFAPQAEPIINERFMK